MEPKQECGDCRPITLQSIPVIDEFADVSRDMIYNEASVFLGNLIKISVNLRGKKVIPQVASEELRELARTGSPAADAPLDWRDLD